MFWVTFYYEYPAVPNMFWVTIYYEHPAVRNMFWVTIYYEHPAVRNMFWVTIYYNHPAVRNMFWVTIYYEPWMLLMKRVKPNDLRKFYITRIISTWAENKNAQKRGKTKNGRETIPQIYTQAYAVQICGKILGHSVHSGVQV